MPDKKIPNTLRISPPRPGAIVAVFMRDGSWLEATWSGKGWSTPDGGSIYGKEGILGWIPITEALEVAKRRRDEYERRREPAHA